MHHAITWLWKSKINQHAQTIFLLKVWFSRLPFSHEKTVQLAATCPCMRAIDRSSHEDYRSILVLKSLANTPAGQSDRRFPPAPIRTRERLSRTGGQRRILFNWTRTPVRNTVQKAVFSLLQRPVSFIRYWPNGTFWVGGIETWLGVVRKTNRIPTRPNIGNR